MKRPGVFERPPLNRGDRPINIPVNKPTDRPTQTTQPEAEADLERQRRPLLLPPDRERSRLVQ
jgi:hypothetical protein